MHSSPLPQGCRLPGDVVVGKLLEARPNKFWIHATADGSCVLLLATSSDIIPKAKSEWRSFDYGPASYFFLVASGVIGELSGFRGRPAYETALAFAHALAAAPDMIGDGIFIEATPCILPLAPGNVPERSKARVLGAYLTGGVDVPADDVVALQQILPSIQPLELAEILSAAGIEPKMPLQTRAQDFGTVATNERHAASTCNGPFELAGRKELTAFFNEHIIDIVADEARYAAMGIGFPGAIVLEGPTGCGKTFAVERLIEHLGWPSFSIEASSVASPYIHETSRKVAEIFSAAMKAAPAVIVIDEMDAFLASRDSGTQQHSVEEVAEFLRRIPEANANRVLVIGMTNKLDAIDQAILRRGRFDHVIHVDHASAQEVASLLAFLLKRVPHEVTDITGLALKLAGRPLSDTAFVVREAGRLAARARRDKIGDSEIVSALGRCTPRNPDDRPRIGF